MALLDRLFNERELHDPRPIRAVFSNTVLAPLSSVATARIESTPCDALLQVKLKGWFVAIPIWFVPT